MQYLQGSWDPTHWMLQLGDWVDEWTNHSLLAFQQLECRADLNVHEVAELRCSVLAVASTQPTD